ncbi:carboxylic ester hydrolase-like isoform X2 [Macrobrachium nipponense]|uniref:carboxylic ester hydrolase-like isoform X2 n=1 Tax=Macrobrachium nipponense TaxID=159736 RepID=UPI0030C8C414
MAITRILFSILVVATWVVRGDAGQDAPVANTEEGRVVGIQELSTKGKTFFSYYSIPFAQPPVGGLRFKDPVPASSWDGILDSRSVPPLCLQIPFMSVGFGNISLVGQEDCLFLNVFTHKLDEAGSNRRRPVLVFVHGGGFFSGGTADYLPHVLMNEEIVFVTLQYRLGILGFLSTENDLISGNFGLKDQTEALRWVQRNIAHFGGDPGRVTIFGESAGAASVHFQILSPKSKGLFQRAILQSGTAMCPWALGAAHIEVARHTSKLVNCPSRPGPEMIRCLQEAPAEELAITLKEYFGWIHRPLLLGPRVDGDYLPAEPDVLMKEGTFAKMDIISGITSHEGGLFALPMYAKDELRRALEDNFSQIGPVALEFGPLDYHPSECARKVFEYYLGGVHFDHSNADDVVKMFTDRHFAVCHDLVTMLHSKNDVEHKTYRYELEYRGGLSVADRFNLSFAKHWVTHVDDIFYLFKGGRWQPLTHPRDLELRDIFTRLWANFAETGNPTPDSSMGFTWEPSSESNLHYLSLTTSPLMTPDRREQVRDFFATLPLHQNQILQGRYPSQFLTTHPPEEEPDSVTHLPPTTTPTTHFADSVDHIDSSEEREWKPSKIRRDEL